MGALKDIAQRMGLIETPKAKVSWKDMIDRAGLRPQEQQQEVQPPLRLEDYPDPEDPDVTPAGKYRLILDESSGRDHLKAYKDSKGISTIGHGFNLEEKSNHAIFTQVTGHKPEDAIAGKVTITKDQQDKLLDHTVGAAEADVKKLVPGFDKLRPSEQDALVNFMFNVGLTTASKFKNTFAAINRGDGKAAAQGILKSAYARQVGKRAERVAAALETIGTKDPE